MKGSLTPFCRKGSAMPRLEADYKSMGDLSLVRASLLKDAQAFEELVNRHFSAVFLTAHARLHDHEAAEDLAQEVFLRPIYIWLN